MGDFDDAFMRNQNASLQARPKVQNRANVLQLKLIGQSHPTGLTANLLKLFEPRPPLEYKPPLEKRRCPPYTGMARFVSHFTEPGDPEYAPPVQEAETPAQRRARIQKLRLQKGAEKAAEELKTYEPNNDPEVSGDPYKTLFVARLNYETSESRIKREFESYGPIKRAIKNISAVEKMVRLVTDTVTNKPKGYAFIEYVHSRDMKAAYKQADGRKIDGRRVLVDVERGRTVPNWRPRRLGGGLGTSRVGGEGVNHREQLQSVSSRTEEPRIRDDRERDQEKSHERGRERDRERERSHERTHDRPRDRDREERDRHHRDRDRTRDRDRDKERERERRERDRGRDYERDRERNRHRERDRDRDHIRDRDYEADDHDNGRSHNRETDYDHGGSMRERDRHGENYYDHPEMEEDHGWHEQHEEGHRRSDIDINQKYDPLDDEEDHDHYDRGHDRMDYHYDRDQGRTRDMEHDYRRSGRDYDH